MRDTEAMDRPLLDRIANGDRDALATLYNSYHARLCAFLYRLTRRTDLIDEVINECFWVVWQKASSFRQTSPVSNWIMGIAFRVAQKTLRRRRAQPVDGDNVTRDLTVSSASEEVAELRDWITKGLAYLTSDQRLVLELIYGEGHSADDVATITGVPLRTVKARLFRARVNLRNVLPVFTGGMPQTRAPKSL
jgi:RNA polymerase sigma-70 factor (ECF subfamily)